ncbi:MAG: SOS response-associated peptidase family protein, partial [Bacillota bacterium]
LVINSRSENADVTPMFQKAARERRCLVPASHFFEWRRTEGRKSKEKFAFRPDTEEPLMYMAGFYGQFPGGFAGGFAGGGYDGFAILTREADGQMSPFHNRMPVILTDEDLKKAWLNHDIAYADLRPAFEPPKLRVWAQLPDENQPA